MATSVTTKDVVAALERSYFDSKRHVIMSEVRETTGFAGSRSADLIVADTWPSGGHQLIGYEVKISRSDWLRELKDPCKADPFLQFCAGWYLAIPDGSIVKSGELPESWGLVLVNVKTHKVRTLKRAPTRQVESLPIDFVMMLLRRAAERAVDLRREIETRASEIAKEQIDRDRAYLEKQSVSQYAKLKKSVDEFQERSGLCITDYGGGNLGDRVKIAESFDPHDWLSLPRRLKEIREDCSKLLPLLEELEKSAAKVANGGKRSERDHRSKPRE